MVRKLEPEVDPRKPTKVEHKLGKKQKHHGKGFSEGIEDNRQHRIGFKKYLERLEEELIDDELETPEED